ncbi:hypothetical protein Ccrd_015746 [Cynara cardunculus var. scolymus]|uniref:Hydroxyproline-rich glycoprotein family protein n=1 Tax=Cynara cardunculus var. scolymus TaxID=59895 RepID=A0A118K3G9_CYNCS|nr:hypothetical protein Ccrd_015746 [Cynara cardunculus var. scolymus]
MGNVKDDGKKMDPLFPRLHITETDKGGPRTPPRNKMAISHQLNVPSQRCLTGSVSPILPLSNNNGSSLVPANSSYHTIETTNCQTLCNGGHLKRGDYCLFKPQDFKSTNSPVKKPEDEDDYLVPSLSFGNGQYRGKFPTLTTNPHIKHPTIKPTDKGVAQDNKLNATTVSKEPVSYYSDRLRFSEMLSGELAPLSPRKTSILVDELQMLQDSSIRLPLKRKSFQETEKDGILGEPELGARKPTDPKWTLLGDDRKTDHEVLDPTESPELLQEDNFYKLKKLPSSDDIFPNLDHHHRNETSLAFPIETTLTKPLHFNTPNPIELPSPPPPPPSTATKQPPWCFLPPPGNQWLVPVRSPSEGLVYKPYTGPYPPPVGLMAPIYAGEFITGGYNLPASYPQGIGVFPTTTQLYGSPTVTKGSSSPTMEDGLMKYNNKAIKSSCNIESEMQGSKGGDHELPLFPTTPTVQDSDQCTEMEKGYDENRIKVIKVVPHNPKLASESAARIFQFIQEERKQYD